MPSPIFNAMQQGQQGQQRPQNRGFDMVESYNRFKQNPIAFIGQMRGIDIPLEYRNDPQQVVQYLMNSGKLTQSDVDAMKQMAQRMGLNLTF